MMASSPYTVRTQGTTTTHAETAPTALSSTSQVCPSLLSLLSYWPFIPGHYTCMTCGVIPLAGQKAPPIQSAESGKHLDPRQHRLVIAVSSGLITGEGYTFTRSQGGKEVCVSQHLMGHVAAQYKAHTGREINWIVTAPALRQLGVTDEDEIARRVEKSRQKFETRLTENAMWDRSEERKAQKTERLTREARARDIFNRYLLAPHLI